MTSSSGTAVCAVTPPSTWAAPDFAANAANALALRARLEALAGTGIMRTAEQGTSTALLSELNAVLNAETPSLASVVTPAFLPVITDSFEEFAEVAAAGPVASLIDGGGQWAPGAAGGITGGTGARGINEGGIEVRQIVHKGLFTGGAFYSEAVRLTTGTINEATIDSIAALWGGNPTLDPAGSKVHSANYSFGMGYHARIVTSLIAAKAYAADGACNAERDAAIVTLFRDWELSMFARALFYANGAIVKAQSAVYLDKVAALHELAEGLGLVWGYHGVTTPNAGPLSGGARVSTDAVIESLLTTLKVNRTDLGASNLGDYVEAGSTIQADSAAAEEIVRAAFGLQSGDFAAIRTPTPG